MSHMNFPHTKDFNNPHHKIFTVNIETLTTTNLQHLGAMTKADQFVDVYLNLSTTPKCIKKDIIYVVKNDVHKTLK